MSPRRRDDGQPAANDARVAAFQERMEMALQSGGHVAPRVAAIDQRSVLGPRSVGTRQRADRVLGGVFGSDRARVLDETRSVVEALGGSALRKPSSAEELAETIARGLTDAARTASSGASVRRAWSRQRESNASR